jgi:hypothetical protein
MQIVINIDDDLYKSIIGHRYKLKFQQKCDYEDLKNAIEDGVQLPKGHGRLIDESKIKKCGWNFIDHHAKTDAPTIIEKDDD